MVYLITIISAISGFLFGYDEGIIAGSLHLLIKEFSMSQTTIGLMTSALPFGAIFGSLSIGVLLSGQLSRTIGRRPLLLIVALFYIIGGIGIALAPNVFIISLSRMLLGIAIGVSAIVTPLYISETAPTSIRGKLVTVYQLAITIGILLSYFINYILVLDAISWRIIYATVTIPAIVLLLGIFFLPESPRWLVYRGDDNDAYQVLSHLRKGVPEKDVKSEFSAIYETIHNEKSASLQELFSRLHLPLLIIGVTLFMLQQLSGIDAVIYYAPQIFAGAGFASISSQNIATIIIGFVNFLSTILAMMLVERWGRFPLLILGFLGTAISLAIIFFASLLNVAHLGWISLFALIAYIIFFAISLGPLPYVIMSEIFPLNIRTAGMSISSISNWSFNTLVVFLFPIVTDMISVPYTFGVFSLLCLFGLFFTIRYVPETKGISLEKIEEYVNSGKPIYQLGKE